MFAKLSLRWLLITDTYAYFDFQLILVGLHKQNPAYVLMMYIYLSVRLIQNLDLMG